MAKDVLDEMVVIKKRCAVTAFDLTIRVLRDGRERGLWIGIQDKSKSRQQTFTKWFNDAFDRWIKRVNVTDNGEKFSAGMSLHSDLGHLLKPEVEEMGLLEWEHLEKVYNAIGKELKKHKEKSK